MYTTFRGKVCLYSNKVEIFYLTTFSFCLCSCVIGSVITYIQGRNKLPDNRLVARGVLCVTGNIDTHYEYPFLVYSCVRMICVVVISSVV